MPPNYREQQGRPLSTNERKGALALVGALVLAGLGVGAWGIASGGNHQHGPCVTMVVPGPTGGGYVTRCGTTARQWCQTQVTAAGPLVAQALTNCRQAKLLPG
ncbi:MAG TPA: hypothetical protein VFN61_02550 [Acidimicrobiales bacterium]|nr:hypothetical protein [Acidimicrobiales bacterium]